MKIAESGFYMMRRVVWGVQDSAHLSTPSLVVSEQQSQVKNFFCLLKQTIAKSHYLFQCIMYINLHRNCVVCLAVSLLWYLAKTTRLRKAALAVGRSSCDIPSPAIGPSSLPSDLSAPAGESEFLLSRHPAPP